MIDILVLLAKFWVTLVAVLCIGGLMVLIFLLIVSRMDSSTFNKIDQFIADKIDGGKNENSRRS